MACPQQDELHALVASQLPADAMQSIARHLDECPTCLAIVETLSELPDPVVTALRQSLAADPYVGEPDCQRAVARFESIPLTPVPEAGDVQPAHVPRAGRLMGQYQLLEAMGRGGMGTVYRALHLKLKREVAVKVMSGHRMNNPAAALRFHREMEAIGKLDHPHIVRATDAGEAEGVPFLVTEFLHGTDLACLVKRLGPLSRADACAIIRQAALGLQHVHEHGLVHRDVKPSNLLLTTDGEVKVLDLGLALLQCSPTEGEEMTTTGQVVGTLDYMAPEQVSDTHTVDIRADIYSLGCTMFYLLVGHPPFAGPAYRHPIQKMQAHSRAAVPSLREFRPELPTGVAAILNRLLAKEPSDRFATPAEVANALEPVAVGSQLPTLCARAQSEMGGEWRIESGGRIQPTRHPPPASRYPWRPFRRRALLATAAALTIGALAATALWLWLRPLPIPNMKTLKFYVQDGNTQQLYVWDLVNTSSENSPLDRPVRKQDRLRLEGELDQSCYWYVLWFDTNGNAEIVEHSNGKQAAVGFPLEEGVRVSVNENDPPGVHLLLLVAGWERPTEAMLQALLDQMKDVGKPVRPPQHWPGTLRGQRRDQAPSMPLAAGYLKRIEDRLSPGLKVMCPVFFETPLITE
jgi:serine/threonine protein kinase